MSHRSGKKVITTSDRYIRVFTKEERRTRGSRVLESAARFTLIIPKGITSIKR